MKRFRALLLVMVVSAYCVLPSVIYSCGPVFPQALFSFKYIPDYPLAEFVEGQLGVVHPGLSQSYLMVAYRYLSSEPLNQDEQGVIIDFWERQHGESDDSGASAAAQDWMHARATITRDAVNVGTDKNTEHYSSYENCQADAFKTAIKTLDERVKQFGKDSAAVQHWLSAQDTVFSNCTQGDLEPTEAAAQDPPIIRADRAYQIAAAHFYAGHLDVAETEFERIAADKSSPWRGIAPYLQARALVRNVSLTAGTPGEAAKQGDALLEQAEAILRKVIADPGLSEWHEASQKRLNMVEARLHPEARLAELAGQVVNPNDGPMLRQELDDFFYLLRLFPTFDKTDMTDWIATMQRMNVAGAGQEAAKVASEHALAKWRATHSMPWLVAAMSSDEASDDQELVKRVRTIPATSPAYLTAALFRVQNGDRVLWDSVIAISDRLPASAKNRFLDLRAERPQTMDEFLKHAAKLPAAVVLYDEDEGLSPDLGEGARPQATEPFFDYESAYAINRLLPLKTLTTMALRTTLPEPARKQVTKAAWVRAFLLHDWKTTAELREAMDRDFPETHEILNTFFEAKDRDKKEFLGAVALLQLPGMIPMVRGGEPREGTDQFDEYRDNWWCNLDEQSEKNEQNALGELPQLSFLTSQQKADAARERKALSEVDDGKVQLSEIVLAYQKKHPDDPLVPGALDFSLRAIRYGCGQAPEGFMHHVFNVLHAKYPKSAAAKRNRPWGEW